jgi:YVTN family beta-propeller protein
VLVIVLFTLLTLLSSFVGALPPRPTLTGAHAPSSVFAGWSPTGVSPSHPILSEVTTGGVVRDHWIETTKLIGAAVGIPSYFPSTAGLAYAHWDTSFYVAVPPSSVDVIPAGTLNVTAVIPVGSMPFGVAVDNATQQVFVTNAGSDNVTVISGATQKVVDNVTVQSRPEGVACDASDGKVYVADNGSNNVSVISSSSLRVVANISVGSSPLGIAWDSASGKAFVADRGSDQVSVILGSTGKVVATLSVGIRPFGVAVDNKSDNVYITNQDSNNISVISAATDSVVADIPVISDEPSQLQGIAYNSVDDLLWVGAGHFWAIVISPTNESVSGYLLNDPSGVAVDSDTGLVCYTNTANTTLGCSGWIGDRAAQLTFSESGLPSGTVWEVTVGAVWMHVSENTSVSEMVFGVYDHYGADPYNYSYSVLTTGGFVPTPATGYAESVTGASLRISIDFAPPLGSYEVAFNESGLPVSGVEWSVNLSGTLRASSTSVVAFVEPNGTYPFVIGPPSGYSAKPASGSVTVFAGDRSVSVAFVAGPAYPITFTEAGLPAGTVWAVNLSGTYRTSISDQITFAMPNGTYMYLLDSVPGWVPSNGVPPTYTGSISVNGTAASRLIAWTQKLYGVVFTESGLPQGAEWWVLVHGGIPWSPGDFYSNGSMVLVPEPNGTFSYSASTAEWGYSSLGGSFTVNGSPPSVPVSFSVPTYAVTFTESNLPLGTNWSMTLAGVSVASQRETISFQEPNGSYRYIVGRLPGWTTPNFTAVFGVAGAAISIPVAWTRVTYVVTFAGSGLPSTTSWSVTLNGSTASWSPGGICAPPGPYCDEIGFRVANGTYEFTIGPVGSYTATPSSGTITVGGQNVSEAVVFTSSSSTILGLPTSEAYAAIGGIIAAFVAVGAAAILWSRRRGSLSRSSGAPHPRTKGGPPAQP